MKQKRLIQLCDIKVRVWKEVFSNKTRTTKVSHLYKDHRLREILLKGNTEDELKDLTINSYAEGRLITEFRGKYSCKLEIISVTPLSSHGYTNYEI
jgi:hypothetical protein|tara:strand:- start:20 stop:307 length:288 start_codon:yes stop_codon:yes gene_type:complete